MFSFTIDCRLHDRERWLMMLSQQLNLFIAPLRHGFHDANVALDYSGNIFTCTIKINRLAKPPLKISASHSDGFIAIGQTMARAKRTLTRDAQFKGTGENVKRIPA
jgi:hypothetical protein